MLNAIDTTSTRQEACSLVLSGLESLREGLIKYHELGLTTKEIYTDLKAAGWDKSIHFLRRQETAMRKEGLLPESTISKAATQRELVRKTAHDSVENSTPTPVTPVTTEILSPIYDLRTEPVLGTLTLVEDEDEFRNPRCDDADAERDYDECLAHVDAILALTKKYFKSGWSYGKWNELDGECRLIRECCETRKRFIDRQESERCNSGEVVDTTCTA